MYGDAKKILREMNVPFTEHMSRQIRISDYNKFDFIIAMEERNITNIKRIVGQDNDNKIFKLLDFTDSPRDIDDPWYTGDFCKAYYDILYGCEKLFEKIK